MHVPKCIPSILMVRVSGCIQKYTLSTLPIEQVWLRGSGSQSKMMLVVNFHYLSTKTAINSGRTYWYNLLEYYRMFGLKVINNRFDCASLDA